MNHLAPVFLIASAAIMVTLGLIHLMYTFFGNKFHPRDAALEARMKEVSPMLTRETTIWRAMVGFNASHSLGAILFGAVYAYLAAVHASMLFASTFLLVLGLLFLGAFVVLAKRYWFRAPFRAISLATALYVVGLVL